MSLEPRPWAVTLAEHQTVIAALAGAADSLDRIAGALITALRGGRRVYVCGNGGSAADAQHIAAELLGRFKRDRRALPVVALTTDSSTLTAIGNDLGYESVFARQVEALVTPGDVLWVLSTSGTSPNILAAARAARAAGAIVVGFAGAPRDAAMAVPSDATGGLPGLCTHLFRVPHVSSDRIQEAHLLAYHYLCEKIEAEFV